MSWLKGNHTFFIALAIIVAATTLTAANKISGETYAAIMGAIIGYYFGRYQSAPRQEAKQDG